MNNTKKVKYMKMSTYRAMVYVKVLRRIIKLLRKFVRNEKTQIDQKNLNMVWVGIITLHNSLYCTTPAGERALKKYGDSALFDSSEWIDEEMLYNLEKK